MVDPITRHELYRSPQEEDVRGKFIRHFRECPIPDNELLSNLGLFLNSKNLSRILYMDHLYRQILETPGVLIEFGTRWGQNLSLFAALRGIYDPFERNRKIIGFDTFSGFVAVTNKDAKDHEIINAGGFGVTKDYEKYLEDVMNFQEMDNPMSHVKKFDIRKGDASVEIVEYLKQYPETIVALAFFDMDVYEPTKKCLQIIKPHLVKGSVLAFDELNDHDSPGETTALNEVFGLNYLRLKRFSRSSRTGYFVKE